MYGKNKNSLLESAKAIMTTDTFPKVSIKNINLDLSSVCINFEAQCLTAGPILVACNGLILSILFGIVEENFSSRSLIV